MEISTYVQRLAYNHYRNMVPFPDGLEIADEHLSGYPAERLRGGLASLHGWMARIYQDMAESPEQWDLPLHPDLAPRSGPAYDASRKAFEALPMLIYALGLLGVPQEHDGQACLSIDLDQLSAYCKTAKLKKGPTLLEALGRYGLEVAPNAEPNMGIGIRFPQTPDMALALPTFVKACGAFSAKATRPTTEFCRMDMRVLQPFQGRKRSLPITLADTQRPLDEEHAQAMAELDVLAQVLGFRPTFKCSGLGRGEWRASYASSRLGKTLFGFVVEEGRLDVRLMIGETKRILPYLEQCSPVLQNVFYTAHPCQACGKCKVGPVRIMVDEAPCRLCNYALFTVTDMQTEYLEGFKLLLQAQAGILQADAAGVRETA